MTPNAPPRGLRTDEEVAETPALPQVLHPHLVAPPRYSLGDDDPIRLSSENPSWGSSRKNPRAARYAFTAVVAVMALAVAALAIAG